MPIKIIFLQMKRIYVLFITLIFLCSINLYSIKGIKITDDFFEIKTTYVDDDNINGPWDGTLEYPYRCINDGIKNSTNGDILYVFEGIYNETIFINKTLSLIGENKNSTIIDGKYEDVILKITKENTIIKNFTIRNSNGNISSAGIRIESDGNTLDNCSIYRTKTGIHLRNSQNNVIDNCSYHTNGDGIFLDSSDNNYIHGCCFCHNSIGIHMESSNNNQISYSYFYANGISCLINGSSDVLIYHCNISDNAINLGGIFIIGGINISVNNSIISHNGAGLHIYSSDTISIKHCDLFLNTHYAVVMRTLSKNLVVSNCNIRDNFRYGLYIEKKNVCKIKNCNIYNNMLYGIYAAFSYITARYNWWNSPFGPSLTELRKSDRIGSLLNRIKVFPWLSKPVKNIGANWETNEPFMEKEMVFFEKKLELPGCDSDLDGAPDWWEYKWGYNVSTWDDHYNLDEDGDGLSNIEECYTDQYGSNPYKKDIFLEIDWMDTQDPNETNKPSAKLIEKLIEIYKEYDINLHVDIGDLGGGEEIPYCDLQFSFAKLRDLYWNYFLHNDLNNPRKGIFHYSMVCKYCPDLNFPFVAWDHLDTFAISAKWLKENKPFYPKQQLIVGAIAHHLGHTLGLLADTYNGIDNLGANKLFTIEWWKYRNYKSCMNYYWKYKILTYSDGSHGRGDFNDLNHLDFSFFKNSHFEWPKN